MEGDGSRPNRLHRRDTPHHLKNKRINSQTIDQDKVASIIAQVSCFCCITLHLAVVPVLGKGKRDLLSPLLQFKILGSGINYRLIFLVEVCESNST